MAKKNYRGNNTYLIEGNTGDNPKLMGRALCDGRDALYLEFYFGYTREMSSKGKEYLKTLRQTERLNLYLWRAPRSPLERQQNREALDIAKRIRFERGQELLQQGQGYRLGLARKKNLNFLKWMQRFHENYTKGGAREVKRACTCFVDFLTDPRMELLPQSDWTAEQKAQAAAERDRRHESARLLPSQLDKKLVGEFVDYLLHRYRGEGPHTVYKRFKMIINAAIAEEVLAKNPCTGISIKIDNGSLKKDVLSMEEIKRLISAHCPGENPVVRRASLFCLYTGIRFCDVRELTYGNVDFANRVLRFEQLKTHGRSSASGVVIPLSDSHLALIGEGRRSELLFPLPSHTMCLKALRHWTARAGIDKHITWHCARHSFAVNILSNGADIKTVASLLGHSGLAMTEKYTRAVDSLKEAAINSLPPLEL